MPVAETPLLRAQNVHRILGTGDAAAHILSGVNLSIGRDEYVSIVGPSGSGKSTLLYLLGGLDRPSTSLNGRIFSPASAIFINGQDTAKLNDAELAMLRNTGPVSGEESAHLTQTVLRDNEIAVLEEITGLLKAGKNPRRILDVLQLAVAQIVLETHTPENFNMPHHCYEYHNTLAWFWDNFDHPRRLRLLLVAACFANRVAGTMIGLGDVHPQAWPAVNAGGLSQAQVLDRVDTAICALNGAESVAWTQAYCDNFSDRAPLVSRIALAATKLGNDPHNQEIAQCMLMDFGTNQMPNRDRLLLSAAYHTAMHRKYGDPLEPAKRFGRAFDMSELAA